MKAFLCLFVSVAAFGQPGNSQGPTCNASTATPPTVRTEGITELVGDLVLDCTGGIPTAAGQPVPLSNIQIFLNTSVTSRLYPNGGSDALLVIDDPGGTANPNTPQRGQPWTAGYLVLIGTGDGRATYNGTPGHPNVFQAGQFGTNSVTWFGVPIDPPGTNGHLILRATNIRANANQLGYAGSPTPIPILAKPVFSNPFVNVVNAWVQVANAAPGISVGVKDSGSFQWCPGFNGNQIFSETTPGVPGDPTFQVKVREGFAQSFKRKGSAPQNVPGFPNNSESGFSNPSLFPATPGLGSADFATRFLIRLNNVGQGVRIVLPVVIPLTDDKGAVHGSVTGSSPTGIFTGNNFSVSPDSTGVGTAVYEVVNSDVANTNPLSLTVPITLDGTPQTLQVPWHLQASVGFYVPTVSGAATNVQIPAFSELDSGVATPALNRTLFVASVVSCTNGGTTLNMATASPSSPNTFIASEGAGGGSPGQIADPQAAATAVSGPYLIAPRVSNVGIVSLALATTGVTVAKDPAATWLNVNLSGTTTPLTAFMSANNAAPGNYSTTLKFSAPGGLTLSVPVTYAVTQGPWFTRFGFAHSASYVNNVVAPGEPFVIFGGDAFGPATLAGPALDSSGRVVTTLGNTQVLFDGVAAPLYYSVNASGTGQIAGFAPFSLATKTSTIVQVVDNGVMSPPIKLNVLDAVPGLYTADSSGGGQGSILNQDLSINGASNGEAPGNFVVLYGGGAGQTLPGGRDGGLAGEGGALAQLTLPVKVFIDGIAATDIPYSGPAPGLVEGVFQINVRIPAGVRRNANVPVVVQVEDKQTQPGVTLTTK